MVSIHAPTIPVLGLGFGFKVLGCFRVHGLRVLGLGQFQDEGLWSRAEVQDRLIRSTEELHG